MVLGSRYNVLLVNALVFYLGIRAVGGWAPTPGSPPVMQTPAMEVFQHLLRDMDTGGRTLSALAAGPASAQGRAGGWAQGLGAFRAWAPGGRGGYTGPAATSLAPTCLLSPLRCAPPLPLLPPLAARPAARPPAPPPTHTHTLTQSRGSVPADQRAGQPPALPQPAHPLLLLRHPLPLHRGRQRAGAGADHARAAGEAHRQQVRARAAGGGAGGRGRRARGHPVGRPAAG